MTTIHTASAIRRSGTDTVPSRADKPTIAIVGTGWAGWTLAQSLSSSTYNIIVISPSRTMPLTPLLASAACGIYDFRMAEEPVRRKHKIFEKYQAVVTAVNFEDQKIQCRAAIGGEEGHVFDVEYDQLILCPGSETNTFGTEGVLEYTMSMKDVKDAMRLRERMLDCFELASLPIFTDEQRKSILHFAIVGGGPTGVEIAAEMDDTVHDHLFAIYPHCRGLVSISVYDVAERVLGAFGEKLSEYTMERFSGRGVNIRMSRHVEKITKNTLHLKEDGEVGFGICVWAVGNKASSLVDSLEVKKTEKGMKRVLTDRCLRVLKPGKSEPGDEKFGKDQGYYENVFALGDAADIEGLSLPTTAEVALQKAKWLSNVLKGEVAEEEKKEFKYKNKALIAYIGNEDGVIDRNDQQWTGAGAWIAWRSGSLEWSRSWRRKAMIGVYWVLNWIDGREIARK